MENEWILKPFEGYGNEICLYHVPCSTNKRNNDGYVWQALGYCRSCQAKPPKSIIFQAILLNDNYRKFYHKNNE